MTPAQRNSREVRREIHRRRLRGVPHFHDVDVILWQPDWFPDHAIVLSRTHRAEACRQKAGRR